MWEFLQTSTRAHTIILTTHYLEERETCAQYRDHRPGADRRVDRMSNLLRGLHIETSC